MVWKFGRGNFEDIPFTIFAAFTTLPRAPSTTSVCDISHAAMFSECCDMVNLWRNMTSRQDLVRISVFRVGCEVVDVFENPSGLNVNLCFLVPYFGNVSKALI